MCNKLPQTYQLKTILIYELTVLYIQSMAWHGWILCSLQARLEMLGKSALKLILVIGKIQFLPVVELRYLFSCWLSFGSCSPKSHRHFLPHGPLHFQINLLLLHWIHQSLWLCGSQQTVENSLRDRNNRPPYLTPEKSVCRSRNNS